MILVAFVLVLVATVMLIIGTFFDGGTAYIWISIAACIATFGVLAASYYARRRGADEQGARPQPLGVGESRPTSVQSAPRGTGASATATATRERTEAAPEVEQDDEPSVTIVPPVDDETPDAGPDAASDEAPEEEAAASAAGVEAAEADEAVPSTPGPAPRAVAPRRVVRRAPVAEDEGAAAAQEPAAKAPPAWPTRDEGDDEATPAPAASGTPRVVRRARPTTAGGTRRVVRRASASGGAARVVRRAGGAEGEGQRTVRRVVRRATPPGQPAGGEAAAAEAKSTPDRSGTRGKRARAVLSEIKGVGPAKQDALLKRFGSLENMAAASVDELADVKGVGESVAAAIKQALQDR